MMLKLQEVIVVKTIIISIGILLVLVFLSLVILQIKNRQDVNRIEQTLQSDTHPQQLFTKEMIAELPTPVQRYFFHAIAPGTPLPTVVKLDLGGQFRLAQDKPWLPMQSQEILTRSGFVWKATIGRGLSQFQGADYYFRRLGRMQFAILGLVPVVDAHDPDTARSAIGRLVAELMWLPSALLPQQGVQWSAIDNHTIQAQIKVDDEPVTLTFVIDADGRVLESYAPRWGITKDGSWTSIPMGGKCHAEGTFSGFTIPTQVGAGWGFGSAEYFEFFQASIQQAIYS
ncbi:hypothetical protein K9N68_36165 (plasmid) [Kovacikia minuta CCNUW1]|uniref:DUF6544 family protein n=1 Tax=Kovacikia minuta TaxID=2931930 RepID=UPI001CCACE7D|nr:DUF6544 family protein [Kovacikia minuta]UBF30612.1 hypothetical protein K9N68_36165 [Kovacikia minuta CCNUW1]